jgi:hypothetical protein
MPFVHSQAPLKACISTTASNVCASAVNILQKAHSNSKAVAAVVSVAGVVAGTVAGIYKYGEQLSKLAKFAIAVSHDGATRAATAATEIIMTSMEYLKHHTVLHRYRYDCAAYYTICDVLHDAVNMSRLACSAMFCFEVQRFV